MSYMAGLSVRYPDTCGKREAVSAEGSQPWKRARQGKSGRLSAPGFVLWKLAGSWSTKRMIGQSLLPGSLVYGLFLLFYLFSDKAFRSRNRSNGTRNVNVRLYAVGGGHAWRAANHSIRGIREYMVPMGSEELRRRRAPGFVLRRLAGELVDKENDRTVAAPGELGIRSLSSFLSLLRQSFSEPKPFQWHQERQRPSVCCWWRPCLARGEPLHSGNSGIHGPDGVRGTSKAPGARVCLEEIRREVGRRRENDPAVAAPGELGIKSLSSFLSLLRHSFSGPQPFQWHQERQRPSVCCWWRPCLARGEPLHSGNSGIHGPNGVRGISKAPGAWVCLEEVRRKVGRRRENDPAVAAPGELGIKSLSSLLSLFPTQLFWHQTVSAGVLASARMEEEGSSNTGSPVRCCARNNRNPLRSRPGRQDGGEARSNTEDAG